MPFNIVKKNPSPGEITTSLINATDGAGLHFSDGGYVDSPTSAGTEFGTSDFSVEFILNQTGETTAGNYIYFTHSGGSNRFWIRNNITSNNLGLSWTNSVGSSVTRNIAYDMSDDYNSPTHYAITCDRDGLATLYKNGNSVGSVDISAESAIDLGDGNATTSRFSSTSAYGILGTFYRFRTWNKTLSQAEITSTYESASLDYADQWGSQTELVTNGTFTGGIADWDLPAAAVPAYGTNNVVWSVTAGWAYIRQTSWAITVGKKYRLTFDVTGHSADGVLGLWDYGGSNNITTLASITGNGTVTHEFTALISSSGGVLFGNSPNAFVGTMDNVACVEIGCVSDYDLAYANPTQSDIVRNRSDAGDGTAAGGVKQITAIDQLNSRSARIGTSAATPAEGELLVSGNAGIGGTAVTKSGSFGDATTLGIVGTDGSGNGPTIQMAVDTSYDARPQSLVFFNRNNADSSGVTVNSIAGIRSFTANAGGGTDGGGNLKFYTKPEAGAFTERLTIDSSGNVGVGVAAPDQKLHVLGTSSDTVGTGLLAIEGGGSNTSWVFRSTATGDNLALDREYGGAGSYTNALTVSRSTGLATFSAGIAFSGQTNAAGMSATTLNHYEEGTWTPVPWDNDVTQMTTSIQLGSYIRVGKIVYCTYRFKRNDTATLANALYIRGLPFVVSDNVLTKSIGIGSSWLTSDNEAGFNYGLENSSSFIVRKNDASGYILSGDLSNLTEWFGALTYEADV